MATVQSVIFRLAQRVDPYTKNGQAFNDSSAALTISNATNASPIVVTTTTHGAATGDTVYITGVGGNTAANNSASNPYWTLTYASPTTFSLDNSTGNGAYTSGGTATLALIGAVPGDKFTAQRLLDIYNESRFILFGALRTVYPTQELSRLVSGVIVNNTAFTFSASGYANKPTGYISPISLTDAVGNPINILPSTLSVVVAAGNNPHFVESGVSHRSVFDENTTLSSVTGTGISGYSGYKLKYFGLSTYALSDVTGNSTVEAFNDDLHGLIVEIGNAIANEAGNQEVIALAQKLVGK